MNEHVTRKGQLLMLLLSIAMVLAMVPGFVMSSTEKVNAEGNVAKIDDTEYATLQAAFDAVPTNGTETTVILLQDSSAGATLQGGRKAILDMKGYTITGQLKIGSTTVTDKGYLTITGEGTVTFDSTNSYGTLTLYNGELTIENGTFEKAGDSSSGAVVYALGTIKRTENKLTINGGTFTNKSTAGTTNYALRSQYSTVNVSNAEFSCTRSGAYTPNAIYTANGTLNLTNVTATVSNATKGYAVCVASGTATINSGTYVTYTGANVTTAYVISLTGGNTTIKNGTFTGGKQAVNVASAGTTTIENGTFTGVTYGIYCTNGTTNISGGKFYGAGPAAYANGSSATLNISGGVFTGNPDREVNAILATSSAKLAVSGGYFLHPIPVSYLASADKMCSDTPVVDEVTHVVGSKTYNTYYKIEDVTSENSIAYITKGEPATTTYYNSLSGAMTAAVSGDQIILNKNCAENATLKEGVTLNTNGKTYNGTLTAYDKGHYIKESDGVYENALCDLEHSVAYLDKGDENPVYYTDIQSAVDAAVDGNTVVLTKDSESATGSTLITIESKNISLDMNNHSLSGSFTSGLITVSGTANVTIKDSSEKKGGIITNNSTGSNSAAIIQTGTSAIILQNITASSSNYGIFCKEAGTHVLTIKDATITGTKHGVYNTKGTYTITLNGGSITGDTYQGVYIGTADNTVTVNDGAITGAKNGIYFADSKTNNKAYVNGGTVTGSTYGIYCGNVTSGTGDSVTVSGGKIAANGTPGSAVGMFSGSSLTMTGGALEATGTNGYAVTNNGANTVATTMTISGGTLSALNENCTGIYHPGPGTLIISGKTSITGHDAGIEIRSGTATISGGTIKATSETFSCSANESGTTTKGAALAIAQHTTKNDITVNITGGSFEGVKAINESNPQENSPAPTVNLSVENGKFKGDITTEDAKNFVSGGFYSIPAGEERNAFQTGYVASGYVAIANIESTTGVSQETYPTTIGVLSDYVASITVNSTTTYYKTLAEALTAAKAGTTAEEKTITIIGAATGCALVGDYTGITIQGSETGSINGYITVQGNNTVLKNMTVSGVTFNGGIIVSTACTSVEGMTITGNTFNAADSASSGNPGVQIQKGTNQMDVDGLKITDNIFNSYGATNSSILINGGVAKDDGAVTITGNTIDHSKATSGNAVQALSLKAPVISGNTVTGTPGRTFNVSGCTDTVMKNNSITMAEITDYSKPVVYNVNNLLDWSEGNKIYNSSSEEIEAKDWICTSDDDTNGIVILSGTKDDDGKYISGTFVGRDASNVNALAAEGYVSDAGVKTQAAKGGKDFYLYTLGKITYTVQTGSYAVDQSGAVIATSIATVTGGGTFDYGETAALAAPTSLDGYVFEGWSVKNGDDYAIIKGEIASKYEFTPDKDCAIVARYLTENKKFGLNVKADDERTFSVTVDGVTIDATGTFAQEYPVGTVVTLKYTDSTHTTEAFQSWNNESNMIMSRDGDGYQFVIGSKTELKAVTSVSDDATKTVIFETDSEQMIKKDTADNTGTQKGSGTDITLPDAPPKSGYTFENWKVGETTIADKDELKQYIKDNFESGQEIVLTPSYTEQHKVTVRLYAINDEDERTDDKLLSETQVVSGTSVKIEAEGSYNNKTFSMFVDSDGNEIGTNPDECIVYVSGDEGTVFKYYAVFSGENVEKAMVNIGGEAEEIGSTHYIKYSVSRGLPKNSELLEYGIVYFTSSALTDEYLTVENANDSNVKVYKVTANDVEETNGVLIVHMNMTGYESKVVHTKGYVIYKDASGKIYTEYSQALDRSYNN